MKVGLSFGGFGVEPASGIGQREVASKYFLSQARKSFSALKLLFDITRLHSRTLSDTLNCND